MQRTVISTPRAPQAIGPYSQAIVTDGELVFTAGQIAIDPATGQMAGADVATQTRRVLDNLRAIHEAAGSGLHAVVKTTVYLNDMNDFAAMNEVYGSYFGSAPPVACWSTAKTSSSLVILLCFKIYGGFSYHSTFTKKGVK